MPGLIGTSMATMLFFHKVDLQFFSKEKIIYKRSMLVIVWNFEILKFILIVRDPRLLYCKCDNKLFQKLLLNC